MNYSGGTSRWLPNQKKELKRWSFVFCLFIRSGQTEMLTWEKRKIDTKEFLTKMFVNAFEGASNEAPFRSYNNNNNNINNTCDDIIYRLNSLHRKHRHRTYPLKWKKTHLATLTTSCKTDPKNLMEKVRQNKREKGNRKTNTHFKATKVSASVCNGKSLYEVSELRNNRQVENFIFETLRPRQGGQQPLLLSLPLTHSLTLSTDCSSSRSISLHCAKKKCFLFIIWLTLSSYDFCDMLWAGHWHTLCHVLWFLGALIKVNSRHRRESKHGCEGI